MEDENEPPTSEPATTTERAHDSARAVFVPIGIGIAVAIGAGVGVLLDSPFLGIAGSLVVGTLIIGVAMARRNTGA